MRSDGVAAISVIPIVKHDFIAEPVLIFRIMLQRGEAATSLPFSSRPGSAGLQLSLLRTDHDVPHPRKHAPRDQARSLGPPPARITRSVPADGRRPTSFRCSA